MTRRIEVVFTATSLQGSRAWGAGRVDFYTSQDLPGSPVRSLTVPVNRLPAQGSNPGGSSYLSPPAHFDYRTSDRRLTLNVAQRYAGTTRPTSRSVFNTAQFTSPTGGPSSRTIKANITPLWHGTKPGSLLELGDDGEITVFLGRELPSTPVVPSDQIGWYAALRESLFTAPSDTEPNPVTYSSTDYWDFYPVYDAFVDSFLLDTIEDVKAEYRFKNGFINHTRLLGDVGGTWIHPIFRANGISVGTKVGEATYPKSRDPVPSDIDYNTVWFVRPSDSTGFESAPYFQYTNRYSINSTQDRSDVLLLGYGPWMDSDYSSTLLGRGLHDVWERERVDHPYISQHPTIYRYYDTVAPLSFGRDPVIDRYRMRGRFPAGNAADGLAQALRSLATQDSSLSEVRIVLYFDQPGALDYGPPDFEDYWLRTGRNPTHHYEDAVAVAHFEEIRKRDALRELGHLAKQAAGAAGAAAVIVGYPFVSAASNIGIPTDKDELIAGLAHNPQQWIQYLRNTAEFSNYLELRFFEMLGDTAATDSLISKANVAMQGFELSDEQAIAAALGVGVLPLLLTKVGALSGLGGKLAWDTFRKTDKPGPDVGRAVEDALAWRELADSLERLNSDQLAEIQAGLDAATKDFRDDLATFREMEEMVDQAFASQLTAEELQAITDSAITDWIRQRDETFNKLLAIELSNLPQQERRAVMLDIIWKRRRRRWQSGWKDVDLGQAFEN